ncbi:MAG: hypothetical protein ACYDBJ_16265 [Aggregatilineales bacterium]
MSVKDSAPSLEQWYTIRDEQVKPFIEQHSFLLPILIEAPAKIAECFPDASLALEVFTDFDGDDGPELVVYVAMNLSPEEAVKTLYELDDAWWLDAMRLANGKLTIALEAA